MRLRQRVVWPLRKVLSRPSLIRDAGILAGGTATAQALGALSLPILTRLYSPAAMGVYGVFLSYVNLVSSSVTLRYDAAVVSARSEKEAVRLTVLACMLAVPCGIAFGLMLQLMIVAHWLGFDALPSVGVPLAIVATVAIGAFSALRYALLREQQFRIVTNVAIRQSMARGLTQVGLAFGGLGWIGLAMGEVVGRVAGLKPMFEIFRTRLISFGGVPAKRTLLEAAASHKEFPRYSLPSTLVDAASVSIVLPLIVKWFGPESGGAFALTQRVLALPVMLVGASVADAFHSRLAASHRADLGGAVALFDRTATTLALVALVPTVILILWGEELFRVVFGSQWTTAGALAAAMTPWFALQLTVSPLSRVVFVFSGQKLKFIYDALSLTLSLGVLYAGHQSHWGLVRCIWVLSATRFTTYLLYFVLLRKIVVNASSSAARGPSTSVQPIAGTDK